MKECVVCKIMKPPKSFPRGGLGKTCHMCYYARKKKQYCTDCSKEISRGPYSRCRSCYHKKRKGVKLNLTESQRILRSRAKLADKNPMWKGDKVGYAALHEWIKARLPKPELCEDCQVAPAIDLANISQKYIRDVNDWEWLCRRCHMVKDGRYKKFMAMNKRRNSRANST